MVLSGVQLKVQPRRRFRIRDGWCEIFERVETKSKLSWGRLGVRDRTVFQRLKIESE